MAAKNLVFFGGDSETAVGAGWMAKKAKFSKGSQIPSTRIPIVTGAEVEDVDGLLEFSKVAHLDSGKPCQQR